MEQSSNLLITTVQIRETDAEVEKVMFQNFQNTTHTYLMDLHIVHRRSTQHT